MFLWWEIFVRHQFTGQGPFLNSTFEFINASIRFCGLAYLEKLPNFSIVTNFVFLTRCHTAYRGAISPHVEDWVMSVVVFEVFLGVSAGPSAWLIKIWSGARTLKKFLENPTLWKLQSQSRKKLLNYGRGQGHQACALQTTSSSRACPATVNS